MKLSATNLASLKELVQELVNEVGQINADVVLGEADGLNAMESERALLEYIELRRFIAEATEKANELVELTRIR